MPVDCDNPLRKELLTLDEIDTIRKQYGIKRKINFPLANEVPMW
ncbi:hypothetical protein AMURIS_00881 [Acetatifactor muris]|uniref:Uncharacterized protein n=1 Tax=Acetatifactor muris TaxID=879566 RepID=A0A2K4ZCI0_9FIRM|nr:hypothetical protein AMURIS_00881 [Acetatifactor muris]